MGNVFANGLEISGKGSDGKTIAAFPDTCFTPPQTPATPPGVPVPYPSFGTSSDTDKGTSTVKIGGQTVNIKNKSYLSKTTGTEAGCAPKKNLITSRNTGKEYFHSWSNDVKFDGEPVIRFSDMATNDHASPQAGTPPWVHVLSANVGGITCGTLLQKMNLRLHQHNKKNCPQGYQSEHYVGNEYFQPDRAHNTSYDQWKDYSVRTAPCVCIRSMKHKKGGGFQETGKGSRKDTPHDTKTKAVNDYNAKLEAQTGRSPKLRGAVAKGTKSISEQHKECKNSSPATQEKVAKCLTMIFMAYIQSVVGPPPPTKSMEELNEMRTMRHRTVA
ncbi:PAAR motif-containing protein (plasmid) [Rhizobium phaseoli]|uniref:DUF4150 domain-containing protein n=2 Tax=Rhizobium TaxID=379 RepID=A0A7X6F0R3_9HYPH|nr:MULTISPECIES: DUF4150 domain-containing protein [Rhizobium]ACE95024.1 hypothetical conserved protein [Rhizobium etli CIAT 652]MDH6645681.1 hypothetical protein [Rhizobium esperanzae]ANL32096.1 PAAR motif-containing protein [Rhizobium phaseoli]ANL51174.1 PAAR motif-containing protein [Rhizobium phaseoli]ANL70013.1 PAAR motif-containing protein [Rhizobium phaseoli]